MMDVVQQIAFAFHFSAKRIDVFKEEVKENDEAKASMEKRQKLQTLCETRWASGANALFTFKASLEVIDGALHRLANMSDTKARVYTCPIERFDFILPLIVCEHVLQILAPLSEMLQSKASDLIEAMKETRAVYAVIQNERNYGAVWDALYESAVQLAATIGVEPLSPRCAGHQLHCNNTPVDSTEVYGKRSVLCPFYDHVLQELDDRFLQCSERFMAQHLVPSNLGNLTDDMVMQIYQTFSADIPAQAAVFHTEIKRWIARWLLEDPGNLPSTLQNTLHDINPNLYPNIFNVLSVLISMPVSIASAERSFSVMRRMKSYPRSTVTTERLSGLAMFHAHEDMGVDTEAVVRDFAQGKSKRLVFLFNN
ncbi:52 kDa repressor of the inhibitor of the protein kinase-like [Ostrea edulis]|uniref:52 kDa repressor of the inhibitor of the protein kinase-like n=1 Tax=Ostrea edulis TaxID=37623 RepID=UPI0024AF9094|nr:52 kDa repressor of the inhibitor of the protein kinase-like [Ostrea edulis]